MEDEQFKMLQELGINGIIDKYVSDDVAANLMKGYIEGLKSELSKYLLAYAQEIGLEVRRTKK